MSRHIVSAVTIGSCLLFILPGCTHPLDSEQFKVHCMVDEEVSGLGTVTNWDIDCDGTADGWVRFYGGRRAPDLEDWNGYFVEQDLDEDGEVDLIYEILEHRGYTRYVAWVDDDRDGTVESLLEGKQAVEYVSSIRGEFMKKKRQRDASLIE